MEIRFAAMKELMTSFHSLLDEFPIWEVFFATVIISFLSLECGLWVGRRRSRRQEREPEHLLRSMVGAMVGLLTFTLAVTFWIAAAHFDGARQARLNDVNAIRAAYMRADLLQEPLRNDIRDLLR